MKSNSEKLFRGLSVQTFTTAVLAVIEIAYFAIMSRLLTKTDFGYFASLTGILSVFMSLSEAGLGAAIVQKKSDSESYVATTFSLSLILGTLGSIVVFIFAPIISRLIVDDTLIIPLRIMSFTVLLHSLNSCGTALLQRTLAFKKIGAVSIVSQTLAYSVAIIMAYKGFGLYAIVTSTVLLSVFSFLTEYLFFVKFPKLRINKNEISSIVSFGGWLTASTITNNIMQQVDKLLLPKWLSVQQLGSYNRPSGFISTISSKINSIFDSVLFPMLSQIQDEMNRVQSVFCRAIELLNAFSAILGCAFFFNADLIIRLFFGTEWIELAPILRILSINLIFNINNRLVDCFFRSLNYVRYSFYLRCLGLILSLLAIYIGSRIALVYVAVCIVIANIITIVAKVLFLCVKLKCPIGTIVYTWVKSWKSAILIILAGCLYVLFFHSNFQSDLIFAALTIVICFSEVLLFPSLIGREYMFSVYPQISSLFRNITRK